ncbi:MAG TPA: GGDEF domain-containing protein [Solirubrobacterales bacterium]
MRKAIAAVLFGGLALVILYDWVGIGGADLDVAINSVVYDAVVVSAGLGCLIRALRGGPERGAWIAISAAILAWAAGEIWWTASIEGSAAPPYPSPADIGYIAFYPLAILGLYLLVRARTTELDRRLWMDGAIAALGTAALGAALLFEFVADRASGTTAEVVTTLAYPFGDVVLIALIVGVIALTRWRPGRTLTLLLLGLAVMAIADVAFTLQTYDAIPDGNWIEPIYLISAVLLGSEAWQPPADPIRPGARFDGWREMIVPGIVAGAMIVLGVLQYLHSSSALTTVLWSLTMLAVLGRLALSLRENTKLLDMVRTDQLTSLGSQARLRMDLEAGGPAGAERPLTLILLDLNGFKHYNDTFGHPAGDKMLGMLGGRLRGAVAPEGVGYRLGGDEFVVLIEGRVPNREAVAVRAAEALTSKGSGFELSAAWGIASVPEEADSAAAAMQLADVRMYAQKESRRLADPLGALDREALEQSQ